MDFILRNRALRQKQRKEKAFGSWSGIDQLQKSNSWSPRLIRSASTNSRKRNTLLENSSSFVSKNKSSSYSGQPLSLLQVFEISSSNCNSSDPNVSRGYADKCNKAFSGKPKALGINSPKKSMNCISGNQSPSTLMATGSANGEILRESDLQLLTVQARFPNDDLRLFDCYNVGQDIISSEGSNSKSLERRPGDLDDWGKGNISPQFLLETCEEGIAPGNAISTVTDQQRHQTDGFILSPLLQNKFKKMAQRRQSAPSVVIRSVLNRSMRLSGHGHNSSRDDIEENHAQVDCIPFGFKLNSHDPIINLIERKYVREGRVQLSSGLQTHERYLFLFTDMLIVAKSKSSSNYKLKKRTRLSEIWLSSERMDDVSEVTKLSDHSFVLGWPTTNVVANFSSADLKELWWNDLLRLSRECQERESPKTVSVRVSFQNSNNIQTSKMLSVHTQESAQDTLEAAISTFSAEDNNESFQLWVTCGKDTTAYPLIGHERPHAIKMNCIREAFASKSPGYEDVRGDSLFLTLPSDKLSPKYDCQFFLQDRTGSGKQGLEQGQKRLARIKSKTPGSIFGWARKRSLSRNSSRRHENGEFAVNQRTHSDSWESCDEPMANLSLTSHNSLIPSPTPSVGDDPSSPKLFTRPLDQLCKDGKLPTPVMSLLVILYRKGPYTNGIFRKSANVRTTRVVKEKLNQDFEYDLSGVHVHVIAALFKEFLRSIPGSLFGSNNFQAWSDAHQLHDEKERIDAIKRQMELMDASSRNLLRHLACMLKEISRLSDENNMNSFNLSVCFAPSLMWLPPSVNLITQTSCSKVIQELMHFIIDNYEAVFGNEELPLFIEPSEEHVDSSPFKNEDAGTSGEETQQFFGDADDTTEDDKDEQEDSVKCGEDFGQFDRGRSSRKQLQRRRSARKSLSSINNVASSMDSLDQDILEAEMVLDRAKLELQKSVEKYDVNKRRTPADRRHSADVCSLSNDSGFTTLSGDDEDSHGRRHNVEHVFGSQEGQAIVERVKLEPGFLGGVKIIEEDSGTWSFSTTRGLADGSDRVTVKHVESATRRRSEPIVRQPIKVAVERFEDPQVENKPQSQPNKEGHNSTLKGIPCANSTSNNNNSNNSNNSSSNNNNNKNNNNNHNTNVSNNVVTNTIAESYIKTIRELSVEKLIENNCLLPETLVESPVNDATMRKAQRPTSLNLDGGRRSSTTDLLLDNDEMQSMLKTISKHGSRHTSRRSSYTHGCHPATPSANMPKSNDIFYTVQSGKSDTSPKMAEEETKRKSDSPSPVSTPVKASNETPTEKPRSAFVPYSYTTTFSGGIAKTPSPAYMLTDDSMLPGGGSDSALTPTRSRRRSRGKVGALNDALRTSSIGGGMSLFSLSLPSKSSTSESVSLSADTTRHGNLKKVYSFDRRLRSTTALSPGGNFDRSMSNSVRAKINAFNHGNVHNLSKKKMSDTAIHDLLLCQHHKERKTSMPVSFAHLDSILTNFDESNPKTQRSSSQRERRRKDNLVTRMNKTNSTALHPTNAKSFEPDSSPDHDAARKLSDEALLSLSESLAFGNRRTPRSSFSKQASVVQSKAEVTVGSRNDQVSASTRRRSRRKRNSKPQPNNQSFHYNDNNNNNNNNIASCIVAQVDREENRTPIVFKMKELENAEESYV